MSLPPFQALVDEHAADVHRFLVASVGVHDAGDCLQETLLAALRAYPDLRDGRSLRGWLFTIAHHKVVDLHRARGRAALPVEAVPERAAPDETSAGDDDRLWARVRALPPKQRTAVVARFVGDFAYREIAGIVGCSEEAARQNVRNGLKRLREQGEWDDA